jgi:hypothetical protein
MNTNQLSGRRCNEGIILSIITLILFTISANAQNPANFSGRWEFDKSSSDKDETGDASFNGKIVYVITQTSSIMTFANIYSLPGKDDFKAKADTFFIDGKVKNEKFGEVPIKKTVNWSQDKKTLTTSSVMTDKIDGVAQDFLTANTYKLSADGKVLTVIELNKSKLNGEEKVKKVYKKQ